MSELLIPAQTAAVNADFNVDSSTHMPPCTLIANGLGAAESVAVQVSGDDGVTYAAAFDYSTGTAIVLDSTHNTVRLDSPGKYRVVKPTTAAAVGLAISTAACA